MTDVYESRADSIGAGAPADMEITLAMKHAGALAWAKGDAEFDSPQEIASQIFRAMIEAKRRVCKVLDRQ